MIKKIIHLRKRIMSNHTLSVSGTESWKTSLPKGLTSRNGTLLAILADGTEEHITIVSKYRVAAS